jgi:CRP-like cAMP-binding protein
MGDVSHRDTEHEGSGHCAADSRNEGQGGSVKNPWTMKMEQFTRFSEEERRKLDELVSQRNKTFGPGEDILREGDHSPDCHVILSGLACRYKILPNGGRQIMAFLIPGDLCDAEIFILKEMDHCVGAMTPTTSALVSGEKMKEMLRSAGSLAEALWWGTLTDLGVLRERIVDHGRRDAHERVAHLLYELLVRYRMVGEASDDAFEFAITQTDLADATGITPVHVNRILQRLREDRLITLTGKVLTILDAPRLKQLAGFNANYLHLDRVHDQRGGIADRAGDLV